MDKQEAISEGLKLMQSARTALLGTNGADGFPCIKAMMNLKPESFQSIWFSTNTSSKRVRQLKNDNRACVYYMDEINFKGLMLTGTVEVHNDLKSRKLLWNDDSITFYPLGVEDPDYTVLRFTAKSGNYYHGLKNLTFEVE